MKLSDAIRRLEELRAELGDIPLEVRNAAGDFDEAESVEPVSEYRGRNEPQRWRAFIDC